MVFIDATKLPEIREEWRPEVKTLRRILDGSVELFDEKDLNRLGLDSTAERIVDAIIDNNVHMNAPTYYKIEEKIGLPQRRIREYCNLLAKKDVIVGNNPLQYGYFLSHRLGAFRRMDVGPRGVVNYFNGMYGIVGRMIGRDGKVNPLTSKRTGRYSTKFFLVLSHTDRWEVARPVYNPCFCEEPMGFVPRKLP